MTYKELHINFNKDTGKKISSQLEINTSCPKCKKKQKTQLTTYYAAVVKYEEHSSGLQSRTHYRQRKTYRCLTCNRQWDDYKTWTEVEVEYP